MSFSSSHTNVTTCPSLVTIWATMVMLTHLNPPARHLLGNGPYPDEEKDLGLDLTAPDWRNGDRNYMKKLSPTDLYLCQWCTGEFLTVTSCAAH